MKSPVLIPRHRDHIRRALDVLLEVIGTVNTRNGWRDVDATKGDRIALIHSEASELLEWTRKPGKSDHIEAPGETEELADIIIRCVDYADVYGLHLATAIIEKLEFNATRGHRHGGKRI